MFVMAFPLLQMLLCLVLNIECMHMKCKLWTEDMCKQPDSDSHSDVPTKEDSGYLVDCSLFLWQPILCLSGY